MINSTVHDTSFGIKFWPVTEVYVIFSRFDHAKVGSTQVKSSSSFNQHYPDHEIISLLQHVQLKNYQA